MRLSINWLTVGATAALRAAGCSSTGAAGGTHAVSAAGATGTATTTAPPSDAVTGTALGGSATPAPGNATVYDCDQQAVAEPKTYILACGDAAMALNQLAWTGWGTPKATASGVQIQNSCTPTCAAGSPISTKATVTLSGLTAGHYTTLVVVTAEATTDYTVDARGPFATGAR